MNRWLKTDDGKYLNLAHAVSIRPLRKTHRGCHPCVVTMADGDTHTINADRCIPLNLDALTAPIIPAAAGQEVVEISATNDEEAADRPDRTDVRRFPVIGWRGELVGINLLWTPLLPLGSDYVDDEAGYLLVLPDGRLWDPNLSGIETMDEARDRVLREEQDDWDHKHAPKAAAD